ncbi:helix-turn-helix domain-containing protein [Pontibacterium sp. N1Y112]|uniref:Helix-turn-helix domain-containing protein n=1 Tax=Pontibacterium sinense TaxID=2781979 RepID=A0A8J7FIX6_9GAMM|nr:helix-turn-helix domain-containing protein [Pontibacterium sinense]
MSSQTQLDKEETVEEIFPGAEFAAAREAKGQDVEEVASTLNFSSSHLVAIEEGRLSDLPNRVFALGYLRAYARHLGLDEQQAVADYERFTGSTPKAGVKPLKSIGGGLEEPQRKGGGAKWVLSIVVLLGAAGAVNWWVNQRPVTADVPAVTTFNIESEPDSAASPVEVVATISTEQEKEIVSQPVEVSELASDSELNHVSAIPETVAVEPSVSSEMDVAVAPIVSSSLGGDEPAQVVNGGDSSVEAVSNTEAVAEDVVATADVQEVPVVDKPASVVEGEGHLKISFDADCWVEVRDSSGKLLVASVRGAARGVDVRGAAPMKVTLGALSSVDSLTFNNQAVELTQRGRGNILRMTLPVVE